MRPSRPSTPKPPLAPKPFNPKARYALQIEFEPADRAIVLRIAKAFEGIEAALNRIADNGAQAKAAHLNPTVIEAPRPPGAVSTTI